MAKFPFDEVLSLGCIIDDLHRVSMIDLFVLGLVPNTLFVNSSSTEFFFLSFFNLPYDQIPSVKA